MKKILFILTLTIGFQGYSQKTFEVYNFSTYSVVLRDIITKPNTSAIYPEFHSKPYGNVVIPPGGSYVLENTSQVFRFPFESPSSSPYISTWERLSSSSSTGSTIFTSPAAWVQGNSQVFTRMIMDVNGANGNIPTVTPGFTTISGIVTGTNWIVDYDCSNPGSNVWYYTLVIYNP